MEILLKAIASFGVIIVLMFVLLYVLKKIYLPSGLSGELGMNMKVYGMLQIQPRKAIYLVKILNRMLIIGVAENSITLLSEIADPEIIKVVDEIYISNSNGEDRKTSFLRNILRLN
jgi:flagellar biogenesis protein FliO